MPRLFWQIITSLDGYVEGPNAEIDWFATDADFDRYVDRMLASVDGLVLGRVTYEGFASYWPTSTDAHAAPMNALPKYAVGRAIDAMLWSNTTAVSANDIPTIDAPRGLALLGSPTLAASLLAQGIIDEVRVVVMPVLLGRGRPMLHDAARTRLTLTASERFASGGMLLTYDVRR